MEHEPSARLGCRKCTVGATKSTLAGSNAPLSHRYCCLERKAKCPAVTTALKGTQGKGHGCAFSRQREKSPFTAARCASSTVFRTPPGCPQTPDQRRGAHTALPRSRRTASRASRPAPAMVRRCHPTASAEVTPALAPTEVPEQKARRPRR